MMKLRLAMPIFFLLLSIELVAAGPVSADENNASDVERILALRARFNESIAQHDAASIAKFLDNRYQITTSTGEHYQETPEEDVAAWTEIFTNYPDIVYIRTPDTVEVSSYLDLAAENGTWVGRWTTPAGEIEVGGKYFAQWRKAGDAWKIRAEIFVALYCTGPGCQVSEAS